MKQLRRMLCVLLCCAMLLSITVAALAASDSEETRKPVSGEAVETLAKLGITEGGSAFNPAGVVTRAEMARMICIALNGGTEPRFEYESYSFTDIGDNQAAGYVEYCYRLGIVAGQGDGTFHPAGAVTAAEAAKMLLVAIGYDADAEGFTGASWAIAVSVRAFRKGIYNDLEDMNSLGGLCRGSAVQMVYNALQAVMVTYDDKLITGSDGKPYTVAAAKDDGAKTILSEKYGIDTVYAYLSAVTAYDKDTGEYAYGLTGAITGGAVESKGGTVYHPFTFSSAADYTDLFGRYVRVIYKTSSAGAVTPFGVYDAGGIAVTATFGEINLNSGLGSIITVDSVHYYPDGAFRDVDVYCFQNGGLTAAAGSDLYDVCQDNSDQFDAASRIILVSGGDGDDLIDYMIVIPSSVSEVTNVSSDTITAGSVYSYTDDVIEAGVAVGDYVKIVEAENSFDLTAHISRTEAVSGTVVAVKTSNGYASAMIGGVWYREGTATGSMLVIGDTYKFYVVGPFYYAAVKCGLGYGYITSVPYTVSMDSTVCSVYQIWTGSECITVYDMDHNAAGAEQYDVIRYNSADFLGCPENYITNVKVVGTPAAITGYDAGSGSVTVMDAHSIQTSGTIGSGTVILYIDSSNRSGVEGADLAAAGTLTTGEYILNACYYDETGDGTFELFVYDVNNDLANLSNTVGVGATAYSSAAYSVASPTIISADGYSVTADKKSALAGGTVTVTVTSTAAADSGTISVTAAGAASVSPAYQTHTAGSEGTYCFYITMGSAAVTGITVYVNTSNETCYGYVVSTPYLTVVDGNCYTCFEVWTGSETITVYDVDQNYPAVRTPISYAVMSGQYIYNVASVGTAVAITGYDGNNVRVVDTAGTVSDGTIDDDDTTILYVNSTTPAGIEGGDLAVAGTTAAGAYILNAYYYDETGDGIPELIVYDVNNDLYNLHNTGGVGTTP